MYQNLLKEATFMKNHAYHMIGCSRARDSNSEKQQSVLREVRKELRKIRMPHLRTNSNSEHSKHKIEAQDLLCLPPIATQLRAASPRYNIDSRMELPDAIKKKVKRTLTTELDPIEVTSLDSESRRRESRLSKWK